MTEPTEPIYFYGKNNCFSNWYPIHFVDEDGILFENNEQYMMYHKAILFKDEKQAIKILKTNDPFTIKKMGRKVKNFDKNIWNQQAKEIVDSGCLLKFSQNEDIKNILLSTDERILAEASPYDKIWGIGINETDAKKGKPWKGENWLGECLMRVRDSIINSIHY